MQSRLTSNYIETVVTNDEPRFLVTSSWCCQLQAQTAKGIGVWHAQEEGTK